MSRSENFPGEYNPFTPQNKIRMLENSLKKITSYPKALDGRVRRYVSQIQEEKTLLGSIDNAKRLKEEHIAHDSEVRKREKRIPRILSNQFYPDWYTNSKN